MQCGKDGVRRMRGIVGMSAAGLCLVLIVLSPRSADAYIDPGTGGTMFSALAPILGVIGIAFLAALGFFRAYIRVVVSFLWRHGRWFIIVMAAGLSAFACVFLDSWMRPGGPASVASVRDIKDQGDKHRITQTVGPGERARELLVERHRRDFRSAEQFRLFTDQEYPEFQRCKYMLGHVSRSCFAFDRSGQVEKRIIPEQGQSLLFYVAAEFPQDFDDSQRVRFDLRATVGGSEGRVLFLHEWASPQEEAHWERVWVDLGDYVGQPVTLRFRAAIREAALPGGGSVCFVSEPRLIGPRTQSGPNVILFSIETLRRDHLSLYGYGRQTSPFLEELAREAIVFEDAYSQSSWTRPSVTTMLTGLYPSQHGAIASLDRLPDSLVLLSEVFRQRGHETAAFCTCELVRQPAFNYDQGFDLFVDEGLYPLGRVRKDIVEWLDSEKPRPFFMFVHSYDPHAPYAAPGRFRDVFDPEYTGQLADAEPLRDRELRKVRGLTSRDVDYVRARYDGEILYTDTVLRQLASDLKDRGLWDNTLLVITADHGEELYEHHDWGHGRNLLPEKLRVPLLLKLPDQAHGGIRVRGLCSGVDLAPTIMETAGIPVPEHLSGINLLEHVETTGETGRKYHYAEFWTSRVTDIESARYETVDTHYAVISEQYEYILKQFSDGRKQEFLYDLEADPTAQDDVAGSRTEVLEKFASLVRERYRGGYTIAANGGGETRRLAGIVHSEAPIVKLEGLRTENDDSFELDQDRKALRFELTVRDDDDLLRFQTEPANAPVTIEIQRRGELPAPTVYLGPGRARCEELPLRVPARRCVLDTDFGRAPDYAAGKDPGLYIWRQGTPYVGREEQVEPDEDTLKALKDLGYL